MKKRILAAALGGLFLCGCGTAGEVSESYTAQPSARPSDHTAEITEAAPVSTIPQTGWTT